MVNRSGIWPLVLVLALAGMVETSRAQEVPVTEEKNMRSAGEKTGIRTDRLTPKQLRIWRCIEGIALAGDSAGQPLHPRLESLWRQAQSIGHTIYIEMPASAITNMAGKFLIEKLDPEGRNHTLAIHLYIAAIKRAVTDKWARRADGFIPFEKLEGSERYAEVLGHELAHAVFTLKEPDYANLSQEQDRATAALISLRSQNVKRALGDADIARYLSKLEFLEKLVEGPPNAVEIEVWRELVKSQSARSGLRP